MIIRYLIEIGNSSKINKKKVHMSILTKLFVDMR